MNMFGKLHEEFRDQSDNSSIGSEDINRISQFEKKRVEEIRILTYNLFMRPPFIKNNEDDYKNERCQEFINKEMIKYDILCLQELFRLFSYRRHKLVYSGIKKGFLYHVSCPQPSFFKSYFVDGGLTILSKYPIVKSEFIPFTYGILADGLSQKGVLYAKIKITQSSHIHVFNTHTQATYNTNEKEIKQTVITRLDQFKEMRKTVDEMLKKYGFERGDICMFAGDFNCDSNNPIHPIDYLEKHQKMKEYLGYNDTQDTFDEYKALIDILSAKGKDILIDIGRESNNGKAPVTFGDIYRDKNGMIQPLETALTDKRDLKSMQSLDYIVQIIPNGLMVDSILENHHDNDMEIPSNKQQQKKQQQKHIKSYSNGGYSINQSYYQSILQNSSTQLILPISKQQSNRMPVVDFKKSGVEKFFVKGQKYTQLSDHYGVSATIRYE